MSNFNFLTDLCVSNVQWRIQAKVLQKWREGTSMRGSKMEMIFIDQKRFPIQATIPNSVFHVFGSSIFKGDWKIISNFQVKWNNAETRICGHPYRIEFTEDTRVENVGAYHNDDIFLNLTKISTIVHKYYYVDHSVEVIGWIVDVQPLRSIAETIRSANHSMLIFEIKDDNNRTIKCRAYNDYATFVNHHWERYKDDGCMCLLRWWFVDDSQAHVDGKCLYSREGCSEISFDPDVPQVDRMRERIFNLEFDSEENETDGNEDD